MLIVKTSSLGDIIHTLPAVTDASRANREVRFDWVVEENFVEIPSWHPAVERVIPVAIRRWRRQPLATLRQGEISEFRKNLQRYHYDLIIDAQGLIKSGILCRMAKGLTVGMNNHSSREPLATLFYNRVFSVPRTLHAVDRVRELFSRALNYSLFEDPYKSNLINAGDVDYGLDLARIGIDHSSENEDNRRPSLLFLHGTTWETKHWPLPYWRALMRLATEKGYQVKMPWGNQQELDRAKAIAKGIEGAIVLQKQTLAGLARHMAQAEGVVAVDTGLGHLAAALAVPTISLYGPTNPGLSGTFGRHQHRLQSTLSCAPCIKKRCHYTGKPILDQADAQKFAVQPPCFSVHPPAAVWKALQTLIMEHKTGSIITSSKFSAKTVG
ncbi:MAG: lipopolysaccharide heptosyltransferase I [Pseudomonadales bacterium]|nr:lipopolysaccharide heptosyltransferase I [Pseudomonadales bacterium]